MNITLKVTKDLMTDSWWADPVCDNLQIEVEAEPGLVCAGGGPKKSQDLQPRKQPVSY